PGDSLVLLGDFNPHMDERDRVQKKTFTKWVNKHLMKRHVTDLYEDLRDGHNLISLLEVLSGEMLPREKGRMRFHKLQNVQIALDFLKHRQVRDILDRRRPGLPNPNPDLCPLFRSNWLTSEMMTLQMETPS
uniref:Calponin-homology (CH) domain-containing protein n=1 Tax=Poecilia mexicana TaxID=48701 RepID=A0A3B3Z3P7_9TELE